ncbi:hypothetical protein PSHT_02215 [Puccinia striiformis]|uniref:Uncharacterized protein n=1 Tax=Puccinia striiformis TaxID=27350 RepID=A0A2S4WID6_9BASI|nr:hypothetical protein PSHT_02215 [Puccinia striiformis]
MVVAWHQDEQAALPEVTAASVGQQIRQAQALQLLPPDNWARGVSQPTCVGWQTTQSRADWYTITVIIGMPL